MKEVTCRTATLAPLSASLPHVCYQKRRFLRASLPIWSGGQQFVQLPRILRVLTREIAASEQ